MRLNVKIAEIPFTISLNYEQNSKYFDEYLTDTAPLFEVCVTKEHIEKARRYYKNMPEAHVEFCELQFLVSKKLQDYNCCEFHALCLKINGKAWLLTGRSGVGKSTQYFNLKKLYGEEINIISGDKVYLKYDDGIIVYSCPWKGKENIGTFDSAPLGGTILLLQKKENVISKKPDGFYALPIFQQFMTLCEEPEEAIKIAFFAEKLIKYGNIFCFENLGNDESSEMLYRTILKSEEK